MALGSVKEPVTTENKKGEFAERFAGRLRHQGEVLGKVVVFFKGGRTFILKGPQVGVGRCAGGICGACRILERIDNKQSQ